MRWPSPFSISEHNHPVVYVVTSCETAAHLNDVVDGFLSGMTEGSDGVKEGWRLFIAVSSERSSSNLRFELINSEMLA